MTEQAKRLKVSTENTEEKFEHYRNFIRNHDFTLFKSLETNDKAKKHLATLNEYRWITFGESLTNDFIVQSVGYQLKTRFPKVEKLLRSELDGFYEDESGVCLFQRDRHYCDFVSVFNRLFFDSRRLVVSPFIRSVSSSVMWLLLARITLNEQSLDLLSRLEKQHELTKKKKLPEFRGRGLDVIVESELCREFFESLTDRLGSLEVKRLLQQEHGLTIKIIASYLDQKSFQSFSWTCKRVHEILSGVQNRAEITDIRFCRQFGEDSEHILVVRRRFYPKDYPISKFKNEAIMAAKNLCNGIFSMNRDFPICLDILNRKDDRDRLFYRQSIGIYYSLDGYYRDILDNPSVDLRIGLFDEENLIYNGKNVLDCCFSNWLLILSDWDVAERICKGDRDGSVLNSLVKHLETIGEKQPPPGVFKLLLYCINNVYMAFDERDRLKNMLRIRLDYAQNCIFRIINDYQDCDFYYQYLGYFHTDTSDSKGKTLVRCVVAVWLQSQSEWLPFPENYIINLLVMVNTCEYVNPLYRINKNEKMWTAVLFALVNRNIPFEALITVSAVLVNGKNAKNKNPKIPYYHGHPDNIIDLARRIVLSNDHYSVGTRVIEMIPLMARLKDKDFWSSCYLRFSNQLSVGGCKRFLAMLRHYDLVNEQLEYLLQRGIKKWIEK